MPLALLLAGCAKGSFNAPIVSRKDATLVFPITAVSTSIDPGKVTDGPTYNILYQVGEGLVGYDEKNRLEPRLAERWDVSKDGLTYTFHLRKGARFSNGREMTADDVRWTWERNLAPDYAAPLARGYLGYIAGALAYGDGKAASISGLRVVDAHTLSVTLDKPRAYFLACLTTLPSFVLAKEAATLKEATKPEMVIGTGPFRIARIIPDTETVLEPNPHYWGTKPKLDRIRLPIVTDPNTRLLKYKTGELDYADVGPADVESVAADPALRPSLVKIDAAYVVYLYLNQKVVPAFRNVHVRRALGLASDRARMARETLGYNAADGFVPPGVPGFPSQWNDLPFDPEAARRELAEGGFPGGRGFPTLEFEYSAAIPEFRIVAETVATDLTRHLGIKVGTKALTTPALIDRYNNGRSPCGVMDWGADYLDPQNFLSIHLTTKGDVNHESFSDPEIDALCASADREASAAKRLELYRRAERRAVRQALRVPLYFNRRVYLVSPRIKGLRLDGTGIPTLAKVEIVK